jgi:hypothetical protein
MSIKPLKLLVENECYQLVELDVRTKAYAARLRPALHGNQLENSIVWRMEVPGACNIILDRTCSGNTNPCLVSLTLRVVVIYRILVE